ARTDLHPFPTRRSSDLLLATVGSAAWTGIEDDWHGAPMYWSHADRDTYLRWLEELGFRILWTRFIPEGSGGHTLLFATRSSRCRLYIERGPRNRHMVAAISLNTMSRWALTE